jgi:para-nitrobenzyl esterase
VKHPLIFALSASCLSLLFGTQATAAQPLAPLTVTGGQIAGLDNGDVNKWLGIPFAAPPVGNLRWRSPQPVIPWQGVKATQDYSPACAQTAAWLPNRKSEDCLYLNVWAPKNAKNLPVMVWIHGGGYYGGSAAQPSYDGANLAKHGAIIVTINYRLGVLGFFAHPELSAESPHKASGNQGIEDQIAALQWVRDNIAAFGGDSKRVTIFGNSAGGESVAQLMASPVAKGLFQRAISQSGNFGVPIDASENAYFSRKAAEERALTFARAAGAAHISDLRHMSVEDLHKVAYYTLPSVDGYVLREDLTTTFAHKRHNDVPLMAGWVADEGKDLAPELLFTNEFTAANYKALVTRLLGHAPSPLLLAAYPGNTDAAAKASINRLSNDWWGWRMWYWAGLQARYGKAKPYLYYFTHMPAQPTPCYYGCGVGHGAEILFAFDNLDVEKRDWTTQDRQLATKLADIWVGFASGGAPGKDWPPFDGSDASIHIIAAKDEAKTTQTLPDFSLFSNAAATAGR